MKQRLTQRDSVETEWRGVCQAATEHAPTGKRRKPRHPAVTSGRMGLRLAQIPIRAARRSNSRSLRPRDHLPHSFIRRQARSKDRENKP